MFDFMAQMAQNQKNTLSKVKPPQELDIWYSILWKYIVPESAIKHDYL